jgi:hypothetical protein
MTHKHRATWLESGYVKRDVSTSGQPAVPGDSKGHLLGGLTATTNDDPSVLLIAGSEQDTTESYVVDIGPANELGGTQMLQRELHHRPLHLLARTHP